MNRKTYTKLAAEMPHLSLPPWYRLRRIDRMRARFYSRETVIARRAAKVLGSENGLDALQEMRPGIKSAGNHSLWLRKREHGQ